MFICRFFAFDIKNVCITLLVVINTGKYNICVCVYGAKDRKNETNKRLEWKEWNVNNLWNCFNFVWCVVSQLCRVSMWLLPSSLFNLRAEVGLIHFRNDGDWLTDWRCWLEPFCVIYFRFFFLFSFSFVRTTTQFIQFRYPIAIWTSDIISAKVFLPKSIVEGKVLSVFIIILTWMPAPVPSTTATKQQHKQY